MATQNRCSHIPVKRQRNTDPFICLVIAGAVDVILLCPDCYGRIMTGKKVKMTLTTKGNKLYNVFKARESTQKYFIELRTDLIPEPPPKPEPVTKPVSETTVKRPLTERERAIYLPSSRSTYLVMVTETRMKEFGFRRPFNSLTEEQQDKVIIKLNPEFAQIERLMS